MAWYNAGTITVTNGSTIVTGAGTDFVTNVAARDALLVDGGAPLEIASVQSATQLTLASPWLGGSAGGRPYKVQPTVGIYVDLALRALGMLDAFAAVRDGIGQGMIPSGTQAAPGIRFSGDQDTGIARLGENIGSLIAGGVAALSFTPAGVGIGTTAPVARLHVTTNGAVPSFTITGNANGGAGIGVLANGAPIMGGYFGTGLIFGNNLSGAPNQFGSFDPSGNLLVGVSAGTFHRIEKAAAAGADVALIRSSATGMNSLSIVAVGAEGYSQAAAGVYVGRSVSTNRSLNAGGTINASGADYAEYMTKAAGCGDIAKGDVCGVDRDGRLTRSWADAVHYVVKSTDPNLVGGDTWAAHMPSRPEALGNAPVEPVPPVLASAAEIPAEPVREDGEEEIDFIRRMAGYLVAVSAAASAATADREAMLAYQAAAVAYPAAKAAHDAAQASYEADLAAWEIELETARQTVDRIAFSGQVPVNVGEEVLAVCEGALEDGEAVYLVAVARGGGIGAQAVRESDMTLPLYMRRLGAVWAIRDGRPIIDVQHG